MQVKDSITIVSAVPELSRLVWAELRYVNKTNKAMVTEETVLRLTEPIDTILNNFPDPKISDTVSKMCTSIMVYHEETRLEAWRNYQLETEYVSYSGLLKFGIDLTTKTNYNFLTFCSERKELIKGAVAETQLIIMMDAETIQHYVHTSLGLTGEDAAKAFNEIIIRQEVLEHLIVATGETYFKKIVKIPLTTDFQELPKEFILLCLKEMEC